MRLPARSRREVPERRPVRRPNASLCTVQEAGGSGPGHQALLPGELRVMSRRPLLPVAALAGALLAAAPARAADRVAVLILPESGTEPALADNLTEIAIARIAERQRVQLAGTVEFRRQLGLESQQ